MESSFNVAFKDGAVVRSFYGFNIRVGFE